MRRGTPPSTPFAESRAFKRDVATLYALLLLANGGAWVWALHAFHRYPILLGTALLAYGLGLRHAIDADHIAAIDNVTRKLMHAGARPAGVGFYFSLGHSTIVVAASVAIAATATALGARLDALRAVGGTIGAVVSSGFLLIVAVINGFVLADVYRVFRCARARGSTADPNGAPQVVGGALLTRICRPLFGAVRRSWHMYPLGLLFGLGFDTATEIGLLGISAAQAARGMSIWSILVFPALFTAGMSLLDTTDSVVMVGVYGWALANPMRKLYYNLTITFASIVVALLVGAVEVLGLVREHLGASGTFWRGVATLNSHFGALGYTIVGIFLVTWALSTIVYRWKGYDRLETTPG